MNRPGPAVIRHPDLIAAGLVGVTVRFLPADHRDRYSDEFRADLCYLSRRRQVAEAIGLLAGAISLRQALKETNMNSVLRSVRYWKCSLGRHRYQIVNDQNPENRKSAHLECSRCLKLKEIKEYEATNGIGMARGGGGLL